MRAYQTIREMKVGHDRYFNHPKGEVARRCGKGPMRRWLKRSDRQRVARTLSRELRQEFHEDVLEVEAFEEETRQPTEAEIREWYSDYLYPERFDDYDSPGDWDYDATAW